jgi:catechol 2,3-dioxygenase-like lactoylglutathione lyase family enzyme
MLRIDRVLETALYVGDMGRAVEFYQGVFGFAVLARSAEPDRLTALDIGGTQVLLLFKKGASLQAVVTPGGKIPL